MARSKKGGAQKKPRRKQESIKGWLVRQCGMIRRHVEVRGLATESEIADVWPKDVSAHGIKWARVYGFCRVWVARQDYDPAHSEQAEERMLEALNEEPRQLRLPASARQVAVYPKSLRTLLWFRAHDWFGSWLAARAMAIRDAADAGELEESDLGQPVTVLGQAEREMARQLEMMAAVACHEGPGIPVEAEDTVNVPSWPGPEWDDLDVLDLYAIHSAFMDVNAGRMEALERIVKPISGSGTNDRMSWNVFTATLAMRLKKDPTHLARDYSLVKLLSMVRLGRQAEPEIEV